MNGTIVRIKYVTQEIDRHGKHRIYFRAGKGKRTALRGPIGSPEFWQDYQAAGKKPLETNSGRNDRISWICNQYFGSVEFKQLAPITKKTRRNVLNRFCVKHGDKRYANLEPRHLRKVRLAMKDTPDAWNDLRKVLIQVYRFAINEDLVESNPARKVEKLKPKNKDGFHAWTLEEVEEFELKHPIGTKARLAMAVLLYTGQRRGDVVRLGRQHEKEEWLVFDQEKTGKRMEIPIVEELQEIINSSPTGDLTYITTAYNRPFTAAGFGNRFRKWCDAAGLPQCSAHGLRKAAAERLALVGCTPNEIMAITGHTSLAEVERYTRRADQRRRAGNATKKLRDKKRTKTP